MKIDRSAYRIGYFAVAVALQFIALLIMAIDPAPHGFSSLSLNIAPILLMIGLLLPVLGLSIFRSYKIRLSEILTKPYQSIGFTLSFLISFFTYVFTLEPTASLWDCSETIAAAYKLQVPHTPGTPLTLLIARLFAMLAMGDVFRVAWFINLMSAFFSALAVGFSFLIIWYYGTKLSNNKSVIWLGGLGGAMCLTFSDSFWFSAVEAETYGPSVFFMIFMIWLSIQGSRMEGGNRRLKVLQLAYIVGLSYCIHPMCILILPVCVLILRLKSHVLNWKELIISISIGVGSILFISKVIAVDIFEWAFRLDLFFINHWSLPFYSGILALLLIMIGLMIVLWIKVRQSRLLLTPFVMLLLGFSPYLMLFIRSSKMPPINEFTPNNLAKIKPYMNRESYPSRPLLYGPYFDAQIQRTTPKTSSYVVKGQKYKKVGEIPTYHYDSDRLTILPRMYSNDPMHIKTYREWTGLVAGEKPRFLDNLKFMIRYQLGEMYVRYLLWNFAGRASDIQHADWLTPWEGSLDRSLIGYSKATNQYFMLPILFGLLGAIFHYKRDRKSFIINLLFFLITGFLLAIYLNATPNEPRERDYIYVGSYVAFCLWIGIGFISIGELVRGRKSLYLVGFAALCIPAWMLYQNLDDHDRSDRTFQMEHARSVLGSCEPNAILFTGGDNDTFPLWYLQDVEGFRTDVRVKVLSYFNADWYINQLSRQYYDSPPFYLTLKESDNEYGPYNPLYVHEKTQAPILWEKYMEALKAKNPQLLLEGTGSGSYYYLPSRHLEISTSLGKIQTSVGGTYLPKNELAILDIISSNDWKRPMYFNFTGLNSLSVNLRSYLIQEGLVYKLTPEKNNTEEIPIDLSKSYENLIHRVDYTNLSNTEVYFNHEDYQSRMIMPIKFAFNTLILAYIEEGNLEKAREITLFAYDKLYHDHLEPSYADIQLTSLLARLDMNQNTSSLMQRTFQFFYEKIDKQLSIHNSYSQSDLLILQEATRFLRESKILTRYEELVKRINLEINGEE